MAVGERIDAVTAPYEAYEQALGGGRLTFQRCDACANAWLPPRAACPRCLAEEWSWEPAGGTARLISWVVYHRAYDESFADRVPYPVLLIELAEGPRMIAALEPGESPQELQIDAELDLRVDGERRQVMARMGEHEAEGEALSEEEDV